MKKTKKKKNGNDFDFYRKWEATRKNVFKEDDKKVDRISNLPDDILAHILSLLSLREATRAKILSTRWLRLDSATATIVSLDFPFPTERQRHLLCNGYIQSAKVNKASMLEYISWLDQTLDFYKGRFDEKKKIHKFKIDIPSMPEADSKYLNWLEFALSRETESLDIRMIYWKRFNEDHHHDLSLLPTMEKSMASMPNIKCIKELSLSQVRLESYSCGGEDEVWSFLSKLVCLERLSIESLQCLCPELSVHGIAQLKHLNISKFSKDITSIRVYDMKNLASLRCHGLEFYVLDVKNVPELVDFTIVSTHSERDGKVVIPNVHDKVGGSIVFPQPSRVRLSIRLNRGTGNQDYYVAPFFERLKRMELCIVMEEECSIRPLFSLIETFFAMEELEIKFSWSSKATYEYKRLTEEDRRAAIFMLKTVRLHGYRGTQYELEFLLFVVNNATNLKELIIVEAPHVNYQLRPRFLTRAFKHLQSLIPNSVRFRVISTQSNWGISSRLM